MRPNALFQLGMDLGTPSTSRKEDSAIASPASAAAEVRDDHFVVRNGVRCAGVHLIVDLYEAERLDDVDHIEAALRRAVAAASATLLHIHLHHFEPNGGVSGVAVLAESHISIHTWPERDFAAIDIFMCGACDPYRSVPVIEAAFRPRSMELNEQRRGLIA